MTLQDIAKNEARIYADNHGIENALIIDGPRIDDYAWLGEGPEPFKPERARATVGVKIPDAEMGAVVYRVAEVIVSDVGAAIDAPYSLLIEIKVWK